MVMGGAPNTMLIGLRLDKGLSRRDAAQMIGISIDTLARAEAKGHYPRAENGFRIAKFYGLKYTDLWPIEESGPNTSKEAT